jgi:hypothetical protein
LSGQAVLARPESGQEWADGLNPGMFWVVVDIDELDRVGLVLCRPDGEATESYMQWPLNRWAALVEKQLLSLREPADG